MTEKICKTTLITIQAGTDFLTTSNGSDRISLHSLDHDFIIDHSHLLGESEPLSELAKRLRHRLRSETLKLIEYFDRQKFHCLGIPDISGDIQVIFIRKLGEGLSFENV